MIKANVIKVLIVIVSTCVVPWVSAEKFAVIVHMENSEELTEYDVRRLFLGKSTTFPSGAQAQAVSISSSDPAYEDFARIVLNKTPAQLRAYWAKRVFTGKGRRPVTVETWDQLHTLIRSDESYISYSQSKQFDGGIRLVMFIE